MLASHGESSLMELLLKWAPSQDFLTWMRAHKTLLRDLPVDRYFDYSLEYEDIVKQRADVRR